MSIYQCVKRRQLHSQSSNITALWSLGKGDSTCLKNLHTVLTQQVARRTRDLTIAPCREAMPIVPTQLVLRFFATWSSIMVLRYVRHLAVGIGTHMSIDGRSCYHWQLQQRQRNDGHWPIGMRSQQIQTSRVRNCTQISPTAFVRAPAVTFCC